MDDLFARDDTPGSLLGQDAAKALRSIARSESIKEVVQQDQNIHDALLGVALRFVGGESLEECCAVAKMLNATGDDVTIDFMGESTKEEAIARHAAAEFHRIIGAIREHSVSASISLDLTHIGLAIDPELAFSLSSDLADAAASSRLEMVISAEGSERTDNVLDLYERLAQDSPNIGITLQAYLHRTADDLQRVLALQGKVRIVKGAFHEPTNIALERGKELNDRYVSLVERIVASQRPLSIATHDPVVLDRLMNVITSNQPDVEVEMLYGVQPRRLETARQEGYSTRVYLPYGREWFLYVCHRLAEHPPNIYQAVDDAVGRWIPQSREGTSRRLVDDE